MNGTESEVSLVRLATEVVRARWRLVGASLFSGLLVGAIVWTFVHNFTVHSAFTPATTSAPQGALSAVAAQFGFAVGGGGLESPQFYADVIKSDRVLRATAEGSYSITPRDWLGRPEVGELRTGSLVDLLELAEDSSEYAIGLQEAIRYLTSHVRVRPALETGIVYIDVQTRWPDLSKQISDQLLRELQETNVSIRQARASSEREFIERRLAASRADLAQVEESLQQFLSANRTWQSAPALVLRYERLQSEVSLRRQIVMTLSQGYEQARIEEVRNTPLIAVITSPREPPMQDRRGTAMKALAVFLVVFLLGVLWIALRTALSVEGQANVSARKSFEDAVVEAKHDLYRLVGARRRKSLPTPQEL